MQVDSIEQGEQIMRLIKKDIGESDLSIVFGEDIPEGIPHARDYDWREPLVD